MSKRDLSLSSRSADVDGAEIESADDQTLISLYGAVLGVVCDGRVSQAETEFVQNWRQRRSDKTDSPTTRPFFQKIDVFLRDGRLSIDEALELYRDLEAELSERTNFRRTNAAVRLLTGFLNGIASDSRVDSTELKRLVDWLSIFSNLVGEDSSFDDIYGFAKSLVDSPKSGSNVAEELAARIQRYVGTVEDECDEA